MRKNKLVIIQPALGRYRKGFVNSLVELNDGEFDISIICSKVDNTGVRSMDAIDSSINYFFVKMTSFFNLFFWQHLFLLVYRMDLMKYDHLVINGNPRFLSSVIISIYLKFKGVRVYWWGHAWSSSSSRFGSFIRFKIMNLYNVILYTDEELELTKNLINSDTVALNNGLDVESIRNGITFDQQRFKGELLKIAFIGRYTKKSEFDLLIQALLELPDEYQQKIVLNIIGNIDAELIAGNYPASQKLNINFLGEIWDESEISQSLVNNHVFIYPGSVGLSIIHAFALGLPAIVHNERMLHMPEIGVFEDGVNGLSFEYGSASSLASKIKYIRDNIHVLKVYSDNAFAKVGSTFNTNDMALRFLNFIREKND